MLRKQSDIIDNNGIAVHVGQRDHRIDWESARVIGMEALCCYLSSVFFHYFSFTCHFCCTVCAEQGSRAETFTRLNCYENALKKCLEFLDRSLCFIVTGLMASA